MKRKVLYRVPGIEISRFGLVTLLLCVGTVPLGAQQEVTIKSRDGFPLSAMYYASARPGPGILLLHQCDREGASTGFEELAAELTAKGFHVLIPDYRSYGKSLGGEAPSSEWKTRGYMEDDMEAVRRFLIAQPQVRAGTIGIVGASCGGRHAISLASKHREVKALVFLSSRVGAALYPRYRNLTHLPVFCAVSDADPNGGTAQSMRSLFDGSEHVGSRLNVYKGTAHGTPLFTQDPSLIEHISNWLMKYLRE